MGLEPQNHPCAAAPAPSPTKPALKSDRYLAKPENITREREREEKGKLFRTGWILHGRILVLTSNGNLKNLDIEGQ